MSIVTIPVEIDHGKVMPIEPQLLPETGRGVLTILSAAPANRAGTYSVESGADGLPVIRAKGTPITAALVREIEGLGA
jgi:hypothetical protein